MRKSGSLSRAIIVFLLSQAAAFAFMCAYSRASESGPKKPAGPSHNVILIGWDGAGRHEVKDLLSKGGLPNLKLLSEEGNLVDIDIFRRTDTKSGWARVLTGYGGEITGVYSNVCYGPIPEGCTIFEILKKKYGERGIATAFIVAKGGHLNWVPAREKRPSDLDEKRTGKINKLAYYDERTGLYVLPAHPYNNARKDIDVCVNDLRKDCKVASQALAALKRYKDRPFFFFVHFGSPDAAGHQYGQRSRGYLRGIRSSDHYTGVIIKALKSMGLYGKTYVYVTADHGFDKRLKTHFNAPFVFFAGNDPGIIRDGQQLDIAPTIMSRLGIDVYGLEPALQGYPLTVPAENEDVLRPKG